MLILLPQTFPSSLSCLSIHFFVIISDLNGESTRISHPSIHQTYSFYIYAKNFLFLTSVSLSLPFAVFTESCSASDFNNCSGDELISKLKATNSSYCLMRHNRSINQLRSGNERSSSGASNVTFNFSSNSSSTMQDKSTTDSTVLSSTSTASSNRKQMVWTAIKLCRPCHSQSFINLGIESTKITGFQSKTSLINYTS